MVVRPAYLWAGVATLSIVATSYVAAIAMSSNSSSKEVSPPRSADELPTSPAPAVVKLSQDMVLLSHSTIEAYTEFGVGVLVVSLPIDSNGFRWVEGAAPVSGGRMDPKDAPLSLLPRNLPVVLSYDTPSRDARVTVFGRLAAPPRVMSDVLVYEIVLYDAPGKDSTYTVSSSYSIPPSLLSATISIFGQRLES